MGFLVTYAPPDLAPPSTTNDFYALLGPDSGAFVSRYQFDLSAVPDDRPFFFDRVPLLPWLRTRLGGQASPIGAAQLTLGGETLLVCLVTTSLCALLFLTLPLLAAQRSLRTAAPPNKRARKVPRRVVLRAVLWAYCFAGLGLGFMVVEIALIQRFNLFLGYPSYSLSVVLFTLLLASGVGSLVAGRFKPPIVVILVALSAAVSVYAAILPALLSAALGASTPSRIVIAGGLIAPLGFLMGMPFPSSLRAAGLESPALVSWAWAVNGGASVWGSVLTVVVSMTYGLTATLFAGSAAYLATLLGILALSRLVPPRAGGHSS
jgi:hypothetical protein